MVDREARDKLALATRRFAVGRISEREWEKSLPEINNRDLTLLDVANFLEFSFEDGLLYRDYFLTGKDKLTPESRREVARCVLFLHSDIEHLPERNPFTVLTVLQMLKGLGSCLLIFACLLVFPCIALAALILPAAPLMALAFYLYQAKGFGLPSIATFVAGIVGILLIGRRLCARCWTRTTGWFERPRSEEDELWPFRSQSEFEDALKRPRFLVGRTA